MPVLGEDAFNPMIREGHRMNMCLMAILAIV